MSDCSFIEWDPGRVGLDEACGPVASRDRTLTRRPTRPDPASPGDETSTRVGAAEGRAEGAVASCWTRALGGAGSPVPCAGRDPRRRTHVQRGLAVADSHHPAEGAHRALTERKVRRRQIYGDAAANSSPQDADVTLFDRGRRQVSLRRALSEASRRRRGAAHRPERRRPAATARRPSALSERSESAPKRRRTVTSGGGSRYPGRSR
jgi:hypothetical protein